MEKASTCPNSCVNCGYKFQSENEIRRQNFSFVSNQRSLGSEHDAEMEVQIVDAIFDVFGVAFHDFYPEEEIESVNQTAMARTVSLCCDCTELLTKLYDSFKDLKKASDENSLLWNSVKFKRKQMSGNKWEFQNMGNFFTNPTNNIKREIDIDEMSITDDFFNENGLYDFTTAGSVDDGLLEMCDNNNSIVKQELGVEPMQSNPPRFPNKAVRKGKSRFLEKQRTGNAKEGRLKMKHRKRRVKGRTKRGIEKLEWKVDDLDSLKDAAPIKCCATSFGTDAEFIAHVSQNHAMESEKPEEECRICRKKILRKYLDFHMSVLHQNKLLVFECSNCKKTFGTRYQLRKHRRKEHLSSRSALAHIRLKKVGSKVFCDKCQKYFSYRYYIKYHLPVIHKTDDKRIQCEICGRSVNSEEYLKIHMSMYHSRDKTKICDVCGKTFGHYRALYNHKMIHEADDVATTDKEKFKCTQCGIILKHTKSLKKHTLRMHGAASLKVCTCEVCGKTTKNMTNLRYHMKVHDPNRSNKSVKQNNPTNPEIPSEFNQFSY